MISVNFDTKTNKFLITCSHEYNELIMGLPDRRFRKGSKTWAAPCLRRNVEYMVQHINNPQFFSAEALNAYNKKRSELGEKPKGENKFPDYFEFKNPPLAHQGKGLEKFFPLNEAAIFYEQGLGKTFTSINLCAAWFITNQINAVLVVCPSSIKLVWEQELEEHCPIDYDVHVLTSGKYKKAEEFILQMSPKCKFLVAGVEGLSQGNAIKHLEKFILTHRVAVVIDESSRIKTPGKTRTDRCIKLGVNASKRVILSGTSITQGLEDLYTQFKFLNPDILGYSSFYSYRNRFCVTMPIEVSHDRTIQKIVGYKNEDEFIRLIKPFTERVEKKDALDLPEKTFTQRYITMSPTQKRLYQEMRDEFVSEVGGVEYEVDTVLEQMLRLQQITGGFHPVDDGTTVNAEPIPGKNPKLVELMDLLEETTGQVIVWCQFRAEIKMIWEELERRDIRYVTFHGGCDDKDKQFAVREFQANPKIKVFLATRAAAYGLTLTAASTAIYYSQGYSLEEYAQSQDRIHRIGQKDQCTYIHLVCDKTIDVKIIKALRDKANLADLIYSMIKD